MSITWRPSADLKTLRHRARLLQDIRAFFAARDVLEVETPLLCHATGTDPQLAFFSSRLDCPPQHPTLYLQTSPEFAMKRLLAAGSGCIFQICKAFRNGEAGRHHNPEFTILEWYRIGFTLHDLMDEVAELLVSVLADHLESLSIHKMSYQQLFQDCTGLDPLLFCRDAYRTFAERQGFVEANRLCEEDHALWLDFLFSHCVQPAMLPGTLYLLYGYPAIQSSLARIHPDDPRIAERFEVFIDGIELGNGFFELNDAREQSVRFEREIVYRQAHALPAVAKDQRLLEALASGLPDCSGVAIGLDRLLMLASGSHSISQVLAFPYPHN